MLIRQIEEAEWDESTDVAVIGGGGCGLVSSIVASDNGADVVLFEKTEEVGGLTKLSSGSVMGAGTELQAAEDVEDSPEKLAEDIRAASADAGDLDLIRKVAEESGSTIDWLVEEVGVELTLSPLRTTGHSVSRSHRPVEDGSEVHSGYPIVKQLLEEAKARGVDIRTNTPIEQLVVDDGAVVGVTTKAHRQPHGVSDRQMIEAEKTVLATGDFGANYCLRMRYIPDTEDLVQWGAPGNTGDAIQWGLKLGARVDTENFAYYTNAHATQPEEMYFPGALLELGAILVNNEGERFIDAFGSTHVQIGPAIMEQPDGYAFMVFDQELYDAVLDTGGRNKLENVANSGALDTAETPEELASKLGVPAEALARHVDERLSETRLYGTMIRPTMPETRGGVTVDMHGKVVDEDGDPIPNLFAGGSNCQGFIGSDPSGYLPGNGLMIAFNLGRIIGRTAAEEIEATTA